MYQYHASYLSSLIITLALLSTSMSESDDPILRLDTCSESEVRFICAVNWTEMQWKLDFSRHPDIMARYFSDDMIGSRRVVVTNRATSYTFNLTSTSPLTSTMTANVSRDLNGATVICQNGFTDAALEDKMNLHEPPQPHNLTIAVVMSTDPGDPYVNVVLQWFDRKLDAALNQAYTITISWDPPSIADFGTTFQTTNTSIQLSLLYDQDYIISVVSRNCIGSSIPAIIRIIHFNNCTLIVKDGVIAMSYNCLLSATTTTDEAMVNNYTTDSTLDMATQKHGTVDPLVPSMIASHLFLSAFSCTVGILLGFLVYRCYISKKTQRTTTGPPEPVYTEIVLSENEAYARVNP